MKFYFFLFTILNGNNIFKKKSVFLVMITSCPVVSKGDYLIVSICECHTLWIKLTRK